MGMRIAAVHDGHNASAALMTDGNIVAALQEERLTRRKNQTGFPRQALAEVLRLGQVEASELDAFVFCSRYRPYKPALDREEQIRGYKLNTGPWKKVKEVAKEAGALRVLERREMHVRRAAAVESGVRAEVISFEDHHRCHAAAAAYGRSRSGRRPTLVLTNDGAGDQLCATVSVLNDSGIRRMAAVGSDESLGEVWAVVTAMMGMVPLEHEYKLMGMAPYAPALGRDRARQVFAALFEFKGDGMVWRRAAGVPPTWGTYEYLRDRLEFMRFDWICAGLQQLTEDFLAEWVRRCVATTGIRDVAVGGGVFMNVKANKRIRELTEVESLFVFPSCGDETNPFGACYLAHRERTGADPSPLKDLYLGSEWSEDAIGSVIADSDCALAVMHCEDVDIEVARLLAEGQVVARFSGREEFGARALGARSILADASRPGVVKEINDMIKSRDFWMPFAASILTEDADRYLVNPRGVEAPYMIMTFDTKGAEDIQAAVHPYDLTCRPHVVSQDMNPGFHRLLREFKARTGRGAILNTSFNLHGFPIVHSPSDAVAVLNQSGLRHLAIGNRLVSKTH